MEKLRIQPIKIPKHHHRAIDTECNWEVENTAHKNTKTSSQSDRHWVQLRSWEYSPLKYQNILWQQNKNTQLLSQSSTWCSNVVCYDEMKDMVATSAEFLPNWEVAHRIPRTAIDTVYNWAVETATKNIKTQSQTDSFCAQERNDTVNYRHQTISKQYIETVFKLRVV